MSAHPLTPEARRENAAALAAASGLSLDQAADALALEVSVTADASDPTAQRIKSEVVELLSRTIQRVSFDEPSGPVSAELVVGYASARTSGAKVYLSVSDSAAIITQNATARAPCAAIPPIFALLVACYAAGATLNAALGHALPFGTPDPLVIRFDKMGVDPSSLSAPVDIEHAYMAGAGAIGNGFLWAARHLDLHGQLDIVDDDYVSSGNLNRQMWFTTEDLKLPKVDRLTIKARPFFPHLTLVPRLHRLQDLPEKSDGPWLRRLLVAVDSRRARRQIQNEFPREVFDASTTDIREIVLHYNRQQTPYACLSCIYEPDEQELTREQHIADHLGVSVDEVRTERISLPSAHRIAARFPTLDANTLIGTAYDTLFKTLCGEGKLQTLEGRAIVAPFAFVSVLAGVLLAIELIRRLGSAKADCDFNYWRVSPWHPLFARRRVLRPKQPACAFCGNPILVAVNRALWT